MPEAFIAIGTNLGKRLQNVEKALQALDLLCMTKLLKVSRMYVTEPVGAADKQDMYVNCCAKIQTDLSPHALLGACLGIEAAFGKVRTFKNAARIIDLDVLLYDDVKLNTKELTIPHPRMWQRKFVMAPLSELLD